MKTLLSRVTSVTFAVGLLSASLFGMGSAAAGQRADQEDYIQSQITAAATAIEEQNYAFKLSSLVAEIAGKEVVKKVSESGDSAIVSGGVGFSSCPKFFPSGKAPVVGKSTPGELRELCFDSFAVLHSGESHTPVISVERLTREQILDAKGEERTDKFFADARLPSRERANLEDYAHSGYDRGHMSPAGDMPNPTAMAQSFSLANMVPQAPENNRKTWSKIEKDTRQYVLRSTGDVYIFTGPVFDRQHKSIGPNNVWVPTYLYKLVYDSATGRSWAHWVENTDAAKPGKPITYEELVSRTGIHFLPKS